MASTQGCPNVVIADTPNPIRDLDPEAMRARADAMIGVVIDGLTLRPAEIERRLKSVIGDQIHPPGVVRSSVAI